MTPPTHSCKCRFIILIVVEKGNKQEENIHLGSSSILLNRQSRKPLRHSATQQTELVDRIATAYNKR